MSERPRAQIVIVGGDGVSYGASPPPPTTWKSIFFDEVAGQIDPERVHFVGRLPYEDYLSALQISSAHIYLTYPFVLSWSLLEAMGAGCVVIGSNTDPVREVLNTENGILVPFFDVEQLAERVVGVLRHPHRFTSLRAHARRTILDQYDLVQICLPKLLTLIRGSERRVLLHA